MTPMTDRRLRTIFLIVFVDLLGFGLVLPLLPFYAENYGATPAVTGLLVASYAAAQLIGAPLLGRLSDRYGRRPMLMVSVLGTFVGFLFLAGADPLGRALAAAFSAGSASSLILAILRNANKQPLFTVEEGIHHDGQQRQFHYAQQAQGHFADG
jgi:DHA1 family tetracycline resistance protein-like MFS transporter